MKTAVFPGSFDPVTLGHIDIIRRAAGIFDTLTVLVMSNGDKQPCFTTEERMDLIRRSTDGLLNVVVNTFDGLLADYLRIRGGVIVKGLRSSADFEYEFQMAAANRKLNPHLDTFFMMTDERYIYLSSTIVREVARYGGSIEAFVPAGIVKDITAKFGKERSVNGRTR